MNYYQSRKRVGLTTAPEVFDFTCRRDKEVFAVGYCAGEPDFEGMARVLGPMHAERYRKEVEPHLHKFHSDGHPTEQAAAECYHGYLLDLRMHAGQRMSNQQLKCKECGEFTQGLVEVNHTPLVLCEQHQAREVVARHFPVRTQIVSSW